MSRHQVLNQLVDLIVGVDRPHPTRVAIDGIDAAGKTSLADALGPLITHRGRPVVRASIDGFHRPRAERYRRGPDSPDGYYEDAFDYPTMRATLLDPLGPGGDRHYRSVAFDFRLDARVSSSPQTAAPNALAVVDGVFLLRPELADAWDFTVFVNVDFAEALRRACLRDESQFGSVGAVRERYERPYLPAQRRYLAAVRPHERADVILINTDPEHPQLLFPRALRQG